MPRKPKRPCAYPGCPALADGKYCPKHEAVAEEKRLEEQRRYNRYERSPEIVRQYGARWRRIRAEYVALHPLCEQCLKEGRMVPVEEVHHIKPIKDGGTHRFDNLMSLCQSCHTKLERELGARRGRGS